MTGFPPLIEQNPDPYLPTDTGGFSNNQGQVGIAAVSGVSGTSSVPVLGDWYIEEQWLEFDYVRLPVLHQQVSYFESTLSSVSSWDWVPETFLVTNGTAHYSRRRERDTYYNSSSRRLVYRRAVVRI